MQEDLISQNDNSTIIAKYESQGRTNKSYQSEAELEAQFISDLVNQGYENIKIQNINKLEENLRAQLQRLNNINFSDIEWNNFYKNCINNPQQNRIHKTKMIQTDGDSQPLTRDDGSIKNIKLIDRENIFNNHLQVISQLKNNEGTYNNRYDVSILVNGLPLVHVELKRRGRDLKDAFNQIKDYAKNSFCAGNALYEFVQIFVISNGTITKYYSNSTRSKANNTKSLNDNYSFCISFSDANNKIISDLEDFTKTFFAKRTLLNILTKYCVLNIDNELLVMRPYQIVASEKIINKINFAHHSKLYGKVDSGGYIWHSTGSGKTLTSFKTSLLALKFDFIKKVLFVVDRKDLDEQTKKEYDKYQKGSANATKSTKELKKLIESNDIDDKIIITTIQKLSNFVSSNGSAKIFEEEIVFIFDECHRSQFGEMHEKIIKKFKKYYIFGFTGTPIFADNAAKNYTAIKEYDALGKVIGERSAIQTTAVVFGTCLHSYTILNAIGDKNVLPFRIEYHSTMKEKENIDDEKVESIAREKALLDPKRISKITSYILEHFAQKTKRNEKYILKDRVNGFNSIFATQSIEFAKAYYKEFKKQLKNKKDPLRIVIIYSTQTNGDKDLDDGIDDNESDSKAFLENAINDYNAMFGTNYSLNNFYDYYENVSERLKNKEIDILIVVNIFLTGFDSKVTNTLWVDKNLRYHGLLQSFSRTNRIFNDKKSFGNIVCFRNLEDATNKSLEIFGDKQAKNIVLLRRFEDYLYGYEVNSKKYLGFIELTENLKMNFPYNSFPLCSKEKKQEFIKLFNEILKLENILNVYDDFAKLNPLESGLKQDYQSQYTSIYREFRNQKEEVDINDDIVFEIELIKDTEVDVDYILLLLKEYHVKQNKNKKIDILRSVDSSISLHNKKDLIEAFLEAIDKTSNKNDEDFDKLFKDFITKKKEDELNALIEELNLNEENAKKFMQNAFDLNVFQELGTGLDDVLPKIPLFAPKKEQENNNFKRENSILKLREYFEKYKDFGNIQEIKERN